jgi:hypothetical protein
MLYALSYLSQFQILQATWNFFRYKLVLTRAINYANFQIVIRPDTCPIAIVFPYVETFPERNSEGSHLEFSTF